MAQSLITAHKLGKKKKQNHTDQSSHVCDCDGVKISGNAVVWSEKQNAGLKKKTKNAETLRSKTCLLSVPRWCYFRVPNLTLLNT